MRAAVIADGRVGVDEVPDPSPGPDEVLCRVTSAGINAADLLQRAGLYPAPPGAPEDIPGMEFAGHVVGVGPGVEEWTPGDRVMAVVGGGAQAELVVVHRAHLLAVPVHADLATAGGFPEAYATAHDALVTQGRLRAGDRVLVTGAAGGVGTAAVQLAHALGAHVVACARDERHHSRLEALGADRAVGAEDLDDAGPFDVVLELVGAQSLQAVQHLLARFARVVVIGIGGGGGRAELDLLGMMSRRWSMTGSTLRARSVEEKSAVAAALRDDALSLYGRGDITVVVERSRPIEAVSDAYDAFAAGGKFGKLLLSV